VARFDWFDYAGEDPALDVEIEQDEFFNPVLTGFYPDPGATRVGDDFYIVTSTFAYFPGIPVFHSTDLVNWTQVGNVIDRPGMLDFSGLGISRGVFAPTIEHHDGTFYVANTCVDCGGNFIVTSADPAGPWSDPVWLPDIGGIDPSLYFNDDGRVYIVNNDAPPAAPLYDGHRAIWIREIDPETFQSISEPVVLVDGGVRPEEEPIWIEGPNIYKVEGRYYLSAAEGGTAEGHSQVVLRADDVLGPYTPFEGNPILTQRHLPSDRGNPVTSVGHAKLLQTPGGEWWATFLGVRPYAGDYYNTGRETFVMPVRWEDGWPVIAEADETVPYVLERPDLPQAGPAPIPMNGNFAFREDFDDPDLDPYWLFIRVPEGRWYDLASEPGTLLIEPRTESIGDLEQPSFIGRRQQHLHASASTAVRFSPERKGDTAGLAAFQNDAYYYFLGIARDEDGRMIVELRRRAGEDDPPDGTVEVSALLEVAADAPVYLKIDANGGTYDFAYATEVGRWKTLASDRDGKTLSTRVAGGFVGVTFGMYAHAGTSPATGATP
jgi:alpha-N-arabinofuranosidase